MFTIEKMQFRHLEACLLWEQREFKDTTTLLHEMVHFLLNRPLCWVAIDQGGDPGGELGEIVGFIKGEYDNESGQMVKCDQMKSTTNRMYEDISTRKCHILILYVLPSHRSKGIGRSLINSLIGNESLGQTSFWLYVSVKNLRAISLYESLGFRKVGEIEKLYSDGEAGYKMAFPAENNA